MSDNQNKDSDLDLSVHFLPDWAKQGSNKNIYDKYTGKEEVRGDRPRGPRKAGGGGGDRRQNRPAFGGDGGGGGGGGARKSARGGNQGQRQDRGDRGQRRGRPGQSGQRGPQKREFEPLPELDVQIVAVDLVSNSVAEQIKLSARAFPLFSIANMILAKPERYNIKLLTEKKKGSDEVPQKMYSCALDGTVWLNESDAVEHLLKNHLATFYEPVKTEAEPPKGTYTFVGQCGMSGVILGPPNYHDYQNQLRKLYNERFAKKMSFDRFKSRVKIVKDEETVQKWREEQSFVTTYNVLNSDEQLTLNSWSDVLNHFDTNHRPNLVTTVSKHTISGADAAHYPCPHIRRLVRVRVQDQKRFPLKLVHLLSQQFSSRGLQFFKVNKTVTHVCVSRPHYLDLENTSVKNGIKQIIQFINEHPGCNRKQLIDSLSHCYDADSLPKEQNVEVAPTPSVETGEASDASEASEAPSSDSADEPSSPEASEKPEGAETPAQEKAVQEPSPVQRAIIGDLHWLLYQGNVIEFASSGVLEVAKKPEPKPARMKAAKASSPVPKADTPKTEAEVSEKGDKEEEVKAPETQPAAETETETEAPEKAEEPTPTPAPIDEAQSEKTEPVQESATQDNPPVAEEKAPEEAAPESPQASDSEPDQRNPEPGN